MVERGDIFEREKVIDMDDFLSYGGAAVAVADGGGGGRQVWRHFVPTRFPGTAVLQ